MKINSLQLEAFYKVAQQLNFTRAAEALHVTQSALSQRIAKLEEDLETTLFIRDRTSIRLTESGEKLLRYCQLNETVESELISQLKDSQSDFAGVLRIAGFSSVNRSLLIPSLKRLMSQNPRLSIQMITREVHDLDRMLKSAEADYILTTQKSSSLDIESCFLGYEQNVLAKRRNTEDSEIYLDHDEKDTTTLDYFSKASDKYKPRNVRYLDDIYGLIDGVRNGYGKAVLPLHLIQDKSEFEILDPKRILKVPVYLQYFQQPYYRKIHTIVVEDIRSHFEKKLQKN